MLVTPAPHKYEQTSAQSMTPNASKQGKMGSLLGCHIFIHTFALYVGVGLSKRIPTKNSRITEWPSKGLNKNGQTTSKLSSHHLLKVEFSVYAPQIGRPFSAVSVGDISIAVMNTRMPLLPLC